MADFSENRSKWLFLTCFVALVATSFGFIIRVNIIGDLGVQFNLSETQKGEILGVGLWPFALSIILFSLVVDKIGYGRSLAFALICHIASALITIFAVNYQMLYWGTFILAIGNGVVEAVINPAVASAYPKEKTKRLNILHAGWPGGMVIGGLLIIILIPNMNWQWKVGLVFIPTVIYGLMLMKAKFPVHERVKAGVPFKAMLQEAGVIGAAIVIIIMMAEIGRIFEWSFSISLILSAVLILAYGLYVRSLGRPLFIFLLLIMIPLATTELGTDSWITELIKPEMIKMNINAGWLLIYMAFIMMILRLSAGPILKKLSPLSLLALCSAIAIVGLVTMSKMFGILIFVGATIYAFGKSFFWPTMLGVTAERFPKGGALTLNAVSGVGMLSVGIIGAVFLGNIQDKHIDKELSQLHPQVYQKVVGNEKTSIFGKYKPIDHEKVVALDDEEHSIVSATIASARKNALFTVSIFPAVMLISYLILIFYFKLKGGYQAVQLDQQKE